MSVSVIRNQWRLLAVVGAVLFLYASVLVHLVQTWRVDENYSHELLIPLVIAYLLWNQRAALVNSVIKPSVFAGGSVILLSLFALWVGVAGAEFYLQRLSLVFIIAGVILYLRGADLLRMVWLPLRLLLLAIPIPAIILNQIAFPLQIFASRCAVSVMRVFDVPVLRQGNVIELVPLNSTQTRRLEVAEACSGIRSLMTLVNAPFSWPKSSVSTNSRDRPAQFRSTNASCLRGLFS